MALPVSGASLTGAYVYQVMLNATVGVLVGVTAADLLTSHSGSTVSFGTDQATGSEKVTYVEQNGTTVTQDISVANDLQSLSAFTYTSGGNTYIVANTPLAVGAADITVGNLTALIGGLGDAGLVAGANTYMACYAPGTLIQTRQGEVAIEELTIGDELVTWSGDLKPIKWVGRRSYAGAFVAGHREILPVCIHAGALGDGQPRRDLFVSPRHAMFLHGVLVPAWLLVNGVSVTQAPSVESVHYIHVELDEHAVIWAEGAASESFVDDNSRGMFQNAHEFEALYPGRPRAPAVYCAPRQEDGEQLASIKRMIDHRAGLPVTGLGGPLRGRIDDLEDLVLRGWAQNPEWPEAPVCLEVLVDGVVAGRTLANAFRADLRAAGMGSGRHSFSFAIPPGIDARSVEVRRVADQSVLGTRALQPQALAQPRSIAA